MSEMQIVYEESATVSRDQFQYVMERVLTKNDDVRFRNKRIDDLTREEAIEALHQAIAYIRGNAR